jgi:hypothetical protein
MATISKPNNFTSLTNAYASQVNSNFDTIYNDYNGNITNVNINASAAIAATKINMAVMPIIGATTPNSASFTSLTLSGDITGDVYAVVWTDYISSSTIVGHTGATSGNIRYKKIGKLVFVSYYLSGTSDDTVFTFTVPYTIATPTQYSIGGTIDNGSAVTVGLITIAAGGAVITLNHGVNGAWTNSGTKTAFGQFFFEATA